MVYGFDRNVCGGNERSLNCFVLFLKLYAPCKGSRQIQLLTRNVIWIGLNATGTIRKSAIPVKTAEIFRQRYFSNRTKRGRTPVNTGVEIAQKKRSTKMIKSGISPNGKAIVVRIESKKPKLEAEVELYNIEEAEAFFSDGKRLCELIKGERDETANRG